MQKFRSLLQQEVQQMKSSAITKEEQAKIVETWKTAAQLMSRNFCRADQIKDNVYRLQIQRTTEMQNRIRLAHRIIKSKQKSKETLTLLFLLFCNRFSIKKEKKV